MPAWRRSRCAHAHARTAPRPLDDEGFSTAAALTAGATRRRLRGADLAAPFHGVRSLVAPADALAHARAFRPRMRDGLVFAGVTAARLWGLPVAGWWRAEEPLTIGVPAGTGRTRARGVRTREFDPERLPTATIDGLPVLSPLATMLTMAGSTEHDDLVVLLDALVSPSDNYPGLRVPARPSASLEELRAFVTGCRGMRGVDALRAALSDVRVGAESPPETRCRLRIAAAGLPEPVMQHVVVLHGERVAVIDLAYPALKIAVEYEGEHHLTEPKQWARDIARQELLESLGWIVIRATKADLRGDGRTLIGRIEQAIARRHPARPVAA